MLNVISSLRAVAALLFALLAGWAGPGLAQVVLATDAQTKTTVAVTTDAAARLKRIEYSGTLTVSTRLSKDPDFGADKLLIVVDMTGTGVTRSGKQYQVTAQEVFEKPHGASQSLQFTFPVTNDTETSLSQVAVGLAKLALNVDAATGKVTSASAILGEAP